MAFLGLIWEFLYSLESSHQAHFENDGMGVQNNVQYGKFSGLNGQIWQIQCSRDSKLLENMGGPSVYVINFPIYMNIKMRFYNVAFFKT